MTATAVTRRVVLTDREKKIVLGMSRGDTDHDMARYLHLTPATVTQTGSRLIRRVGVRSRTELVAFALRTGLVPGGFRPVRTPAEVGPAVAALRKRAQMTPGELAHRARITVRHLEEIETGGVMPRLDVFLSLMAVLGAPMYMEAP